MKTFLTFFNHFISMLFVLLSAVIFFTAGIQYARAENGSVNVVSSQMLCYSETSVNDFHPVYVREAEETLLMAYKEYHVFNARTADSYTKVMISTTTAVRNFKVLNLSDCQIDDNGKISFHEETLYEQPELVPGCPIVVIMTLYGTIPNYGISYTDEHGTTRRFSINVSGMDGSVVMDEY